MASQISGRALHGSGPRRVGLSGRPGRALGPAHSLSPSRAPRRRCARFSDLGRRRVSPFRTQSARVTARRRRPGRPSPTTRAWSRGVARAAKVSGPSTAASRAAPSTSTSVRAAAPGPRRPGRVPRSTCVGVRPSRRAACRARVCPRAARGPTGPSTEPRGEARRRRRPGRARRRRVARGPAPPRRTGRPSRALGLGPASLPPPPPSPLLSTLSLPPPIPTRRPGPRRTSTP